MNLKNLPKIIILSVVAIIVVSAVAIPILSDISVVKSTADNTGNVVYPFTETTESSIIEKVTDEDAFTINGIKYNFNQVDSSKYSIIASFKDGSINVTSASGHMIINALGFGNANPGTITKAIIEHNLITFTRADGIERTAEYSGSYFIVNKTGLLGSYESTTKVILSEYSDIDAAGVSMNFKAKDNLTPLGNFSMKLNLSGKVNNYAVSTVGNIGNNPQYTFTITDVVCDLGLVYDEANRTYTYDPSKVTISLSGTTVTNDEAKTPGTFTADLENNVVWSLFAPISYEYVSAEPNTVTTLIQIIPLIIIIALLIGIVYMVIRKGE